MNILRICVKCSDTFNAVLLEDGKGTKVHDGYVPDFMPGEHYGDYVELDIDIATGRIVDWTNPSLNTVKQQLNDE